MHKAVISLSELIIRLKKKEAILITANVRLMQYFQELYSKQQLDNQYAIFESPQIFSYEIWLEKCWQKYRNHCLHPASLLKPHHTHFLWEKIIDSNNPFFFNIEGIVEEVKKAWKLCWSWNITIDEQTFSTNIDTTAFYQWASHYRRLLDKEGWIDSAMLPRVLTTLFSTVNSQQPAIILAGFDRLPPSLLECVNAFSSNNVFFYESDKKATIIHKTTFLSEEEELQAFLIWAKKSLKKSNQVACVIPNLSQKRNKVERFIRRFFSENEYNISAGHRFATCPMISAALKMLSIKQALKEKKNITLKDFYFMIENRYIGEADEEKRSIALKKIHKTENARLSWKSFLHLLTEAQVKLAENLVILETLLLPEKAKPSEWQEIFQTILTTIHWPGSYILDSQEYQTYERWLNLLNEFQQLDLIAEPISFQSALSMLKTIAIHTIFQPSKKNARVHFFGLLEAAGLPIEQLWVTGMSEEEFPANVKLNPFIPPPIQRHYALPHATHEIEHEFAAQLMQQFVTGSNEVVFSYLSQKEGIKIKESPFINSFVTKVFSSELEKKPLVLEIIKEQENIPLVLHEKIKGGTTLLKNQAICPFRAFAKHRLKALGFEKLSIGLAEHERGSLVHEALEKFWMSVKTQQQLLSYTPEALDAHIHQIASQTVKHFVVSHPYKENKLPAVFQKLEIKRLEILLKKWLTVEMQRPPFSVVSIEESKEIQLAGLTLNIRADRIDQLADGKKMVIDYKTGILPTLSLNDERPENPQLLLYTLSDPEVKAWTFAQVKAAEPLFKGNSESETGISGIKPIDWETERTQWKQKLEGLATEFIQGKNQALPKKEEVCDRCDLHGICRIRHLTNSCN